MMTQKRKNYTAEFKREAVRLVTEQGYSMSQAARNLDVNMNMLRRWKHQLEEQPNHVFPGKGRLLPEQEELRSLREENRRLRMERDILKKRFLSLPTRRIEICICGCVSSRLAYRSNV
jgi:transposase